MFKQITGILASLFFASVAYGAHTVDDDLTVTGTSTQPGVPNTSAVSDCEAETGGLIGDFCIDTDDQSLFMCTTATCEGAGWVAQGGGSGTERWDPFMAPASADASGLDDEFTGSLDLATKWTLFDPGNSINRTNPVNLTSPKRVSFDWGAAAVTISGIVQPYDEADADTHFITHVVWQGFSGSWTSNFQADLWGGMIIMEDVTNLATTDFIFVGYNLSVADDLANSPVVLTIAAWNFDDYTDAAPAVILSTSQATTDNALGGGAFFRLKRDVTNNKWRCDWSLDGRGWTTIAAFDMDTDTTFSTFTSVGIGGARRVGYQDATEFSFFRAKTGGDKNGVKEMVPAGNLGVE